MVDPALEKYLNFSPYTYAVNNPLYYIDPDGQTIDVSYILAKDKNGNYKHEDLAQAFLAFAKTELGSQVIAMFAEKGQKIEELGFEATENGMLHDVGLDLTIMPESMGERVNKNGIYERGSDQESGREN